MLNFFRERRLFILLFVIFLFSTILFASLYIHIKDQRAKALVTGTQEKSTARVVYTPTPQPTINLQNQSPSPSPKSQKALSKKIYKIAAIGDSMIETIGGNLDYLHGALKKKYPDTEFYMYNFGISSENVIEALARFDKNFSHAGREYPSLSEVKPDVIIVGSYAYNPPTNYDKNVHWNTLAEVINKSKAITSNVYVLAEIAPLEVGFGNGPGGVNWPPELVKIHVAKIIELMQNARTLPKALDMGLIDVYSKTTLPNSVYGSSEFIDSHDNIHPSIYGHKFIAEVAIEEIKLK